MRWSGVEFPNGDQPGVRLKRELGAIQAVRRKSNRRQGDREAVIGGAVAHLSLKQLSAPIHPMPFGRVLIATRRFALFAAALELISVMIRTKLRI